MSILISMFLHIVNNNHNLWGLLLSGLTNEEPSANTQVKIKVHLFPWNAVRQKLFLRGQIRVMYTNQEQSECPETGSIFQQTVSEIIQFVIQVEGRESKPKVSPIHSTQRKGNPKGEDDIRSGVQKQPLQTKQNIESEIKCRHRVHFDLAKQHGKTGI